MKNLSVQKLSILGLVLMGASAVTAAVMPKAKQTIPPGELKFISARAGVNQWTCKPVVSVFNCDYTATDGVKSFTSAAPATTSLNGPTTGVDGQNTGLIPDAAHNNIKRSS